MKKIIEKLWNNAVEFSTDQEAVISKERFIYILIEAMQKQREACANAFYQTQIKESIVVFSSEKLENAILNAEVE